jgi:hypothetical protein
VPCCPGLPLVMFFCLPFSLSASAVSRVPASLSRHLSFSHLCLFALALSCFPDIPPSCLPAFPFLAFLPFNLLALPPFCLLLAFTFSPSRLPASSPLYIPAFPGFLRSAFPPSPSPPFALVCSLPACLLAFLAYRPSRPFCFPASPPQPLHPSAWASLFDQGRMVSEMVFRQFEFCSSRCSGN